MFKADNVSRLLALGSSRGLRFRLGLTLSCAAFGAAPSHGHVIELSPEGVISIRDGAGAATFDVVDATERAPGRDRGFADAPPVALSVVTSPAIPARYAGMIERAAADANISAALLAALVWQESRWNHNAVSPKGAIGLAQLMPGTARDLGVDPRDPMGNLIGGARYLRQMLNYFGGDLEKALAAYNAGPKRVRDANGIPPIRETRAYVKSIVQRASSMGAGGNQ